VRTTHELASIVLIIVVVAILLWLF